MLVGGGVRNRPLMAVIALYGEIYVLVEFKKNFPAYFPPFLTAFCYAGRQQWERVNAVLFLN